MRRLLSVLMLLACSSLPVCAQPRPGAFTTLTTTDTGVTSACVGADSAGTPTTCTGGFKAGAVTASGLVTSTGFGTHTFSAGGTGGNQISIRNTTAGTTMFSGLQLGNDAASQLGVLTAQSSTYTTTGFNFQAGVTLGSTGAGGLSIVTNNAAGTIKMYSGSGTLGFTLDASQLITATGGGTHSFTGSIVGAHGMTIRNSLAGVANYGFVGILGDNASAGGALLAPSSTYATSNDLRADGLTIRANSTGGLNLSALGATNKVTVWINQRTVTESQLGSSDPLRPLFNVGSAGGAYGATSAGARVLIGNNTDGVGAAGSLLMESMISASWHIWPDVTGVLRINTAAPKADGTVSDTAGTVVGTQVSQRSTKNIFGPFTDTRGALRTILQTPLWNFAYKNGAYNHQEFVGITTDDSPQFGMDEGRVFNPISSFGYTVAAIKELQAEIEQLRADVAALKRRKR